MILIPPYVAYLLYTTLHLSKKCIKYSKDCQLINRKKKSASHPTVPLHLSGHRRRQTTTSIHSDHRIFLRSSSLHFRSTIFLSTTLRRSLPPATANLVVFHQHSNSENSSLRQTSHLSGQCRFPLTHQYQNSSPPP